MVTGGRRSLAGLGVVPLVLVAACSGGGGGGDAAVPADMGTSAGDTGGVPAADSGGGGPIDTGANPPADGGIIGVAYGLSPASLTFHGRRGGGRPPLQIIEITAGVPLYLKAEVSGPALESATVDVTGARTANVEVRPASPNVLPVGTSTASVRIEACGDPLCGSRVPGGLSTVPVTYVNAPGGVSGMPAALTFSHAFGAPAPPPQAVALTDLGDPPFSFTSRLNPETASSWLTVSPASGPLPGMVTIGVVPQARAGTYTGTVQFLSDLTAGFGVNVTYTIQADFRATPAFINVVGAFGTPTANQTISLTDALGLSYPWTVEVTMDGSGWLTLSPSSGSSLPVDVTLSLGPLPDRLTRQALLRFVAAGIERRVQVTYRTP